MSLIPAITKQELADLRAEGITPTDEEAAWLLDLGRAVERPAGHTDYALAGAPVRCGNVVLWPASIASATWFDDVACKQFKSPLMQTYCLAYALIHARNPAIEWETLTSYKSARDAVNSQALRLRCTLHELRSAIARLLPQLDSPHPVRRKPRTDPAGPGIVPSLVAATGLPAAYWDRQPMSFAAECLHAVLQQNAEGEVQGWEDICYRSAMNEFALAADAIRRAHACPK
jgi:hypothetical protein